MKVTAMDTATDTLRDVMKDMEEDGRKHTMSKFRHTLKWLVIIDRMQQLAKHMNDTTIRYLKDEDNIPENFIWEKESDE